MGELGDRRGMLQPVARGARPGHLKGSLRQTADLDNAQPEAWVEGAGAPRRPLRIALAGGGTGGHLVPGLHLLDYALHAGLAPQHVLWLTAGRPVEARVLRDLESRYPGVSMDTFVLPLENPSGGPPSTGALLWRTPGAMRLARKALDFHGSQVLLGLGGFTALPSVLAARRLRLPVALYEVNTVAGRATRRLAFFAQEVLHAWPDSLPEGTRRESSRGCVQRVIGPVVGPSFVPVAHPEGTVASRAALGLDPDRPLLCVLGGSQGAGAINRFVSQHVAEWIAGGWQVVHQVGPGRQAESGAREPHYHPREFLGSMANWLQASTLVLGRGGASTLAEVAAVGVPSWVVPYPHHADRHQWRNAERLGMGSRIVEESQLDVALAQELASAARSPVDSGLSAMRASLASLPASKGAPRLWETLARLAAQKTSTKNVTRTVLASR